MNYLFSRFEFILPFHRILRIVQKDFVYVLLIEGELLEVTVYVTVKLVHSDVEIDMYLNHHQYYSFRND